MIADSLQEDSTTPESSIPQTKQQYEEYLNDARFHKTFQLPADPSRGREKPFTVKYADFGFHRDDLSTDGQQQEERETEAGDAEEEHVILFFGPLLASRLVHVAKDAMFKRHRVRLVNPDRPGIGGTDAVPAEKLLETWRGMLSISSGNF